MLFMGATSGIGKSALETFAANADSAHVYSVARPASAISHKEIIKTLNQSNTYEVIEGDVSLISEVDRIADMVARKESKLDILFLSAGFMAFEGRKDTSEGLDPSMSTRYYSRVRAVQKFAPLLNQPTAKSPRVISVLAGGVEEPLNEEDLDLKYPQNWTFWNASVHSATMGTLALEHLARQYPYLSIIHWFPGPVSTPGLAVANQHGMYPPNPRLQSDAGALAAFIATSDRYAVNEGLMPLLAGLQRATQSPGGIFLVDPQGESADNEQVLASYRSNGTNQKVWKFTMGVFEQLGLD